MSSTRRIKNEIPTLNPQVCPVQLSARELNLFLCYLFYILKVPTHSCCDERKTNKPSGNASGSNATNKDRSASDNQAVCEADRLVHFMVVPRETSGCNKARPAAMSLRRPKSQRKYEASECQPHWPPPWLLHRTYPAGAWRLRRWVEPSGPGSATAVLRLEVSEQTRQQSLMTFSASNLTRHRFRRLKHCSN